MTLYLMYLLILIITMIFFVIIKDKIKAIRLMGILTLSSSILIVALTFITKIILNTTITSINISTITNYIFMKFVNTSFILFIIGIVEILVSKYLHTKKKIKT